MLSASLLPTGYLKYLQIEELGCSPALSSTHSLISYYLFLWLWPQQLPGYDDAYTPEMTLSQTFERQISIMRMELTVGPYNPAFQAKQKEQPLWKYHTGPFCTLFLSYKLWALRKPYRGLAASVWHRTHSWHRSGISHFTITFSGSRVCWSTAAPWCDSNPASQSWLVTTAGKSASSFPHGTWEQVQGCSTSGAPPSPSLHPTGRTLGNTTISKQQSEKRCKEYSKCLLCIKNTANKPYSSFHSNLNNIVQKLEKSTKNSAVPTVTTVTLVPCLPLSLTAILSHLQWEQHWIRFSILFT